MCETERTPMCRLSAVARGGWCVAAARGARPASRALYRAPVVKMAPLKAHVQLETVERRGPVWHAVTRCHARRVPCNVPAATATFLHPRRVAPGGPTLALHRPHTCEM